MPSGIEEAAGVVWSVLLAVAVVGSLSVSIGCGPVISGGSCIVLCIVGAGVGCCRYRCVGG